MFVCWEKCKCNLKWKLLTSIHLNWDWHRRRIHETRGSWRRRSARIWGRGRRARRGLGDSKGFRERRRWWELGGEEWGLGIWGASTFSILGESLGFLVLGPWRIRDKTQRLCVCEREREFQWVKMGVVGLTCKIVRSSGVNG